MGQVFQSQNPRTQFSYFQDYLALKWTNIHKKNLNFERIFTKLTNLIILINNFKNIEHEACQNDESGKFLIIKVCLGIG